MMLGRGENFLGNFKPEILRKLLSVCPVCGNKYTRWKGKVLDETADAELMYVVCPHCGGAMVALVLAMGPVISSIGLITDLTSTDVDKFKMAEKITEDDLIELHNILANNQLSYGGRIDS